MVELRRVLGRRGSQSAEIVLEGPRTVGDALAAGIAPTTVIIPESGVDDDAARRVVEQLDPFVETLVVRDRVFGGLAPSVTPQPMLALAARPIADFPDSIGVEDVVLVLVEVGDPGNVGTLVRVADAVAARSVVVVGGADPWGPKAVRASAGSVLRVPVVAGSDLEPALRSLRDAGARVVATDARRGRPHDSGVLTGGVAIVLGSEPRGLDRRALDPLVDDWARIDTPGSAESLNVAMAGTLLAYEARRSASPG